MEVKHKIINDDDIKISKEKIKRSGIISPLYNITL